MLDRGLKTKPIIEEEDHGITRKSTAFFEEYRDCLGDILAVSCTKTADGDWKTNVYGEDTRMILYGFSFGYCGEGVRGLIDLVKACGIKLTDTDIESVMLNIKGRNKVAFFHKRNLENGDHGHAFIYRECPDGLAGVDVYEQGILAMIA